MMYMDSFTDPIFSFSLFFLSSTVEVVLFLFIWGHPRSVGLPADQCQLESFLPSCVSFVEAVTPIAPSLWPYTPLLLSDPCFTFTPQSIFCFIRSMPV